MGRLLTFIRFMLKPPQPFIFLPCLACHGTGRVGRHVCRNDEECRTKCPELAVCFACLGAGRIAE